MIPFVVSSILGLFIVARVSRIIAVDFIFNGFREWVTANRGVTSPWTYLVHCQWCLSIYLGAIMAGIVVWLAPAPDINPALQVVGLAALFSFATGILGSHYGVPNDEAGEA